MKKLIILIAQFLIAGEISVSYITLNGVYKEYKDNKVLDKDIFSLFKMNGVRLYFDNTLPKTILKFSYLIEISIGDSKYDGQTQSGEKVVSTNKNVSIFNTNINLQIPYKNIEAIFGIGSRMWIRGYDTSNEGDYQERYSWNYLHIGTKLNFYYKNISFSPQISYYKAYNAYLDVYINEGAQLNLKNVYGYSISLPLLYKLSQNFYLQIGYKKVFWYIGGSDIGYIPSLNIYIIEPKSKTYLNYLNIGLSYKF